MLLSPFAESVESNPRDLPTPSVRTPNPGFPLAMRKLFEYLQACYWYHKACDETSRKCALAVGNAARDRWPNFAPRCGASPSLPVAKQDYLASSNRVLTRGQLKTRAALLHADLPHGLAVDLQIQFTALELPRDGH